MQITEPKFSIGGAFAALSTFVAAFARSVSRVVLVVLLFVGFSSAWGQATFTCAGSAATDRTDLTAEPGWFDATGLTDPVGMHMDLDIDGAGDIATVPYTGPGETNPETLVPRGAFLIPDVDDSSITFPMSTVLCNTRGTDANFSDDESFTVSSNTQLDPDEDIPADANGYDWNWQRSTDGGSSWTTITRTLDNGAIRAGETSRFSSEAAAAFTATYEITAEDAGHHLRALGYGVATIGTTEVRYLALRSAEIPISTNCNLLETPENSVIVDLHNLSTTDASLLNEDARDLTSDDGIAGNTCWDILHAAESNSYTTQQLSTSVSPEVGVVISLGIVSGSKSSRAWVWERCNTRDDTVDCDVADNAGWTVIDREARNTADSEGNPPPRGNTPAGLGDDGDEGIARISTFEPTAEDVGYRLRVSNRSLNNEDTEDANSYSAAKYRSNPTIAVVDSDPGRPPSLSNIRFSSNNANSALFAKDGDELTLTFRTNVAVSVSGVTIAGQAATVDNDGNNWTATYTVAAADVSDGEVTYRIGRLERTDGPVGRLIPDEVTSGVTIDNTAPAFTDPSAVIANINGNEGDALTSPALPEAMDDNGVTYSVTPALPAGLSLGQSDRIIRGTPGGAHGATYMYVATDAAGNEATLADDFDINITGRLTVTAAVVDCTTDAAASASLSEGDEVCLNATAAGGSEDYSAGSAGFVWTPTDAALTNANMMKATFTAPDVNADTAYTFTVTVTDSNDNTASASVSLTVVNFALAAPAEVRTEGGQSVTLRATIRGGTAPYTAAPLMQDGGDSLQIAPAPTATVNGNDVTATLTVPDVTQEEILNFTLEVTDADSETVSATLQVIIAPPGIEETEEAATIHAVSAAVAQTTGIVTSRIASAVGGAAGGALGGLSGFTARVNGQTLHGNSGRLLTDAIETACGARGMRADTRRACDVSLDDMLREGAFAYTTGGASGGGHTTVWAQGTRGRFEGELVEGDADGATYDGDLSGVYFGADYQIDRDTLFGVALSQIRSSVEAETEGALSQSEFDIKLTGISPYLRKQFGERSVWAMASFQSGDSEEVGEAAEDLESQTFAGGLHWSITQAEAMHLLLKSELSFTDVDGDAVSSSSWRFRQAMEYSSNIAVGDGISNQRVELGLRADGGDVQDMLSDGGAGAGADILVALGFVHEAWDVDLQFRSLLWHNNEHLRESGANLRIARTPSLARGAQFSLQPEWGNMNIGKVWDDEDIFAPESRAEAPAFDWSPKRVRMKIGYGFDARGASALLTPFVEHLHAADNSRTRYGLGFITPVRSLGEMRWDISIEQSGGNDRLRLQTGLDF